MRAALVVAAAMLTTTAAAALDSETTPLDIDQCEIAEMAIEDEAGEPLAMEDRYPVLWRCAGVGKWFVYITYDDAREGIGFGTKTEDDTRYAWNGHFGGWGPTVEWRGMKNAEGVLEPSAAIVKYGWNVPQGRDDGSDDVGGDLGVIRIGKGRDDTCLVAWVDVTANADALDLAQKAADEAAGQTCPAAEDEYADAAEGAKRLGKSRPE
jgi:hypothetical protein